jgi:hypothetical protein
MGHCPEKPFNDISIKVVNRRFQRAAFGQHAVTRLDHRRGNFNIYNFVHFGVRIWTIMDLTPACLLRNYESKASTSSI